MLIPKLEVWRGSGAGSKRNKVGKFIVPFKKVSLCFRGFSFDLLFFIIGKISSFRFMIHNIQLHIPLRPISSVYATNRYILSNAEFLIHSMLLGTCFSNKTTLFPYAILAIDLKIYKQVSMAEWLGHRSLQINTMKWIKYR